MVMNAAFTRRIRQALPDAFRSRRRGRDGNDATRRIAYPSKLLRRRLLTSLALDHGLRFGALARPRMACDANTNAAANAAINAGGNATANTAANAVADAGRNSFTDAAGDAAADRAGRATFVVV